MLETGPFFPAPTAQLEYLVPLEVQMRPEKRERRVPCRQYPNKLPVCNSAPAINLTKLCQDDTP